MDKQAYRAALLMSWLGSVAVVAFAWYLCRPLPPESDAGREFFELMRQEREAVRPAYTCSAKTGYCVPKGEN